jgi:hypothetical protein
VELPPVSFGHEASQLVHQRGAFQGGFFHVACVYTKPWAIGAEDAKSQTMTKKTPAAVSADSRRQP